LLIAGASDSLAHFVGAYNAHAWEMLGHLEDKLRDARSATSHRRPADDPFWESYIRGLFELTRHEHDENARHVPSLPAAAFHGAGPSRERPDRAADRRRGGLRAPGFLPRGRRVEGSPRRASGRRVDVQPPAPPSLTRGPGPAGPCARGAVRRRIPRDRRD